MKIHTDILNHSNLVDAMNAAGRYAPSVSLNVNSEHKSNSHRRAFDVALRGNGQRHTRRPNPGFRGALRNDEYAATHDDWGYFLAAVYAQDPNAKTGEYHNAEDFHAKTKGMYA